MGKKTKEEFEGSIERSKEVYLTRRGGSDESQASWGLAAFGQPDSDISSHDYGDTSGEHDYREATEFVIVSGKKEKHKTTKIPTDEKFHWFNYRDGNVEREMSLKAYQNAQSQIFSAKGSDYSIDGATKKK